MNIIPYIMRTPLITPIAEMLKSRTFLAQFAVGCLVIIFAFLQESVPALQPYIEPMFFFWASLLGGWFVRQTGEDWINAYVYNKSDIGSLEEEAQNGLKYLIEVYKEYSENNESTLKSAAGRPQSAIGDK